MTGSVILCGLIAWGLIALALGVLLGQAIARADAHQSYEAAAAIARHPSARGLSEDEVAARIREMERRWVS